MNDELARSLQQSVNQKFGIGAYNILDPIKRGGSGYIYKIYSTQEKRFAVLKTLPRQYLWNEIDGTPEQKIKKCKQNKALDERGQNQLKIHQSLHSNYVVKLYNSSKDDTNYYLFMQYFPRGDLQDEIQRCSTKMQSNGHIVMESIMDVSRVRKIGLQLAMGIDTIHKKFIIHRDIKPKNILMGEDDEVKICDFSCATFTKDKKFPQHHNKPENSNDRKQNMKVVGTLQYMAPEVLNKGGNSVDVWSFGCVLYSMIGGTPPFKLEKSQQNKQLVQYLYKINERSVEQFAKNLSRNFPSSSCPPPSHQKPKTNIRTLPMCGCQNQKHSQCLKKLIDLLKRIFVFNPNYRIKIDEIIRHPFFTGDKMKFETEQQQKQKLDTIQNCEANTKREQKQFGSISHNVRNNNFLSIPHDNQIHQSNTSSNLTANRPKPSYSLQNIKKPTNNSSTNSHQSSLHDYHTLEQQQINNRNMTKTQAIINRHKQKYTVETKNSKTSSVNNHSGQNQNNGNNYSSRIVGYVNHPYDRNQYKNQRKQTMASNENVNTLNIKTSNNRENQKYGVDELFRHKLISKPEHTPLSLTPTLNANNPKFISDTHPHPQSSTLPSTYSSNSHQNLLLPFSTQKLHYSLKIAEKQQLITINEQGLKGQFLKSNKAMVISPKGTHVTIIFEDKRKKYELQRLPEKYVPLYESYRTIVQQIRNKEDIKRSSRNLYNTIEDDHQRGAYRAAKTSRNKDQKQRKRSPQRPERSSSIAVNSVKPQQPQNYSSSSLLSPGQITPILTAKFPLTLSFPSLKINAQYMLQITLTLKNNQQKQGFVVQLLNNDKQSKQRRIKSIKNNKMELNVKNQMKLIDVKAVVQNLIQFQIKQQLSGSVKQTIEFNTMIIEQYSKLLLKYCQWIQTMPSILKTVKHHNSISSGENPAKNQRRPYSSSSNSNNIMIGNQTNNWRQKQKQRQRQNQKERKNDKNCQQKVYGYYGNKVESYVQKYR